MMQKKIELLAPVGRIESFYAAIENGANAIYVGGKQFSARQFADNFDNDELREIVSYAKLRNVKVYITLNTIIKNEELDGFVKYVHHLSEIGVDAIITQDFGVARVIKEYFPNMPIHASTQMSAHSIEDVKFLKSCGYERVVLARELTIREIENIKKSVDVELEVFVHGALCVCYSGQCLMSSLIGGRSGNRGRCAQPCRLPYTLKKDGVNLTDNKSPYLMSPKDVQALEIIPQLIQIGVDSLKIEGRMKSPEYVASVIRMYRKYIDLAKSTEDYKIQEDDKDELLTVFNRGGFTNGYFVEKPGKNMMATTSPKNSGLWIGTVESYNKQGVVKIKTNKDLSPGDGIEIWTTDKNHVGTGISKNISKGDVFTVSIKGDIKQGDAVYLSKNHKLLNELKQSYKNNNRKGAIDIDLKAKVGEALKLTLCNLNGIKITITGDIVEKAQNAPVTKEQLYKQIGKFGNTPFKANNINIECDADIYVSISSMNELRRKATDLLINKILENNSYDKKGYEKYNTDKKTSHKAHGNQVFTASVHTLEQLEACVRHIKNIYLEYKSQPIEEIKKAIMLCKENNCKLYIALPQIERDRDYIKYQSDIESLEELDINGYLIRSYGQYERLQNTSKEKILDYTLNIMNDENIRGWETKNIDALTLSVEMSHSEIQKVQGNCLEMLVYGYLPIMITEQCTLGRYGVCQKANAVHDGIYELTDRKDENYRIITDCHACRMQILSSKPIVLAGKLRQLQSLPVQRLRLAFTVEDGKKASKVISWYMEDATLDGEEYTTGYFMKGVE